MTYLQTGIQSAPFAAISHGSGSLTVPSTGKPVAWHDSAQVATLMLTRQTHTAVLLPAMMCCVFGSHQCMGIWLCSQRYTNIYRSRPRALLEHKTFRAALAKAAAKLCKVVLNWFVCVAQCNELYIVSQDGRGWAQDLQQRALMDPDCRLIRESVVIASSVDFLELMEQTASMLPLAFKDTHFFYLTGQGICSSL